MKDGSLPSRETKDLENSIHYGSGRTRQRQIVGEGSAH